MPPQDCTASCPQLSCDGALQTAGGRTEENEGLIPHLRTGHSFKETATQGKGLTGNISLTNGGCNINQNGHKPSDSEKGANAEISPEVGSCCLTPKGRGSHRRSRRGWLREATCLMSKRGKSQQCLSHSSLKRRGNKHEMTRWIQTGIRAALTAVTKSKRAACSPGSGEQERQALQFPAYQEMQSEESAGSPWRRGLFGFPWQCTPAEPPQALPSCLLGPAAPCTPSTTLALSITAERCISWQSYSRYQIAPLHMIAVSS